MKRPSPKASDSVIKNWLRAHWSNAWWGLMDCDRCPLRRDHPCDGCMRWKYLVEDYRDGDLLVPMGKVKA